MTSWDATVTPVSRAASSAERTLTTMFAELEPIGRVQDTGGYRRFAYTDEDARLREWFVAHATARHLGVHEDRAGNLWAWWGDATAGDAVVTGSHLDSVPSGGAFDGPLGIVSAFAAVDALRAAGLRPSRPLAVVAFADEEGARFGVACAGSRLLTGWLDPARARELTDEQGITLAEALRATGRDPAALGPDPGLVARIGVFVELHVEQGRGLIDHEAAVGIATAIRAHGRWRYELTGRADHAGTTRMRDRDDPMLAHATAILTADAAARERGAVATIGRVTVQPNGVNAIPSLVRTWLDVRADEEDRVRAVVAQVSRATGVEPVEESWTPPVEFDPRLRARLARLLNGAPQLATGAGHDAGILALAGVPSAMLFVRNPTGVSHAPEEHADPADCVAGIAALTTVLADLLVRAPSTEDAPLQDASTDHPPPGEVGG